MGDDSMKITYRQSETTAKVEQAHKKTLIRCNSLKDHPIPEKKINYEMTDGEYLLRRNRLSEFNNKKLP